MGDVIVTDTNIPPASTDQILVVLPYNATPTPNSRLKPDTYYSFKNTWRKLFTPIYELLKAYVPITRTLTINGTEYDLSANRSWTVTAAAANLEDVLLEGNDGGGLAIENIADPTNAQDAATKNYVDNSVVNPAGADTQVQFNDGGAFGGDSTFTFNKTTKELTVQDAILTSGTASQIVQLNGSKKLVTSNTLPNGTIATTQSAADNSTKVATTAYVDAAVGYCVSGGCGTSTLADATTYYLGNRLGLTVATGDGNSRLYIPKGGVVTRIDFFARSVTGGSNENSTISFRLNATTDTLLSNTLKIDAQNVHAEYTGLSIAVATGDFFELKMVTPTWVTNPAQTNIWINAFISPV